MKNRIKHVIGGMLIVFGILSCAGATGTMDYCAGGNVSQHDKLPIVQCGVGVLAMVCGFLACKDIEFPIDN